MTSLSNSSKSTCLTGRVLWEELLVLSRFSNYEQTSGILSPAISISLYISVIFLQKSIVQYTIFKTVLLNILKVYNQQETKVPFLAIFGTFRNQHKKIINFTFIYCNL